MPAIFGASEFNAPVAYQDGILFTSEFVKKSGVLKAYLDRINYMPKHIVFVDDSLRHIEDVVNAFAVIDQDTGPIWPGNNIELQLFHL